MERFAVEAAYGAERRTASAEAEPFDVDHAVAKLAAARGGVVARRELLALGLTPRTIGHRIDRGRLHVLHRGVYAVGHLGLGWQAHAHAALLAVGAAAVLSHRSAAVAWRMLAADGGPHHVTVLGRVLRSRPGIVVHSAQDLAVRRQAGLALTTPARTLLDLATCVAVPALDRALAEAQVLRLVTKRGVEAEIARAPNHHGGAALKRLLGTSEPTRSELERMFLAILRDAGLPLPRVNARVGPYTVDALWAGHRVVVETDGWAAHGHRGAFERDRARDANLQARGYAVLRFTWRQVVEEPLLVAARLAQVLSNRLDRDEAVRR